MKKFKVKIIKSNVAYVEVEAEDADIATAIVGQRYFSGEDIIAGNIADEGGIEFDAEEVMKYHIKAKTGEAIASFEHECDRDMCLDTFEEWHPDCEFDKVDD